MSDSRSALVICARPDSSSRPSETRPSGSTIIAVSLPSHDVGSQLPAVRRLAFETTGLHRHRGRIGFRSGDREVVLGPGGYITKPPRRAARYMERRVGADADDRGDQPGPWEPVPVLVRHGGRARVRRSHCAISEVDGRSRRCEVRDLGGALLRLAGQATVDGNLGLALNHAGRHAEGISAYQEAATGFREIGDGTARTLRSRTSAAPCRSGRDDRAVIAYRDAIAIFRETEDREREGSAQANLAAAIAASGA